MEKRTVWNSKVYWLPVLAAVALAYPIFLTTYTIGIDDLKPAHVDDGILHGRPTNYFSNLLLFPGKRVIQPFANILGVVLLVLAVTCLCAFWRRSAHEKVGMPGLGMFAALFISYPMTYELTAYNYMILCIGEGLFLIVAALECLHRWEQSKNGRMLLLASVCLGLSAGAYETNAPLYITLVIATFWLEWETQDAKCGRVTDQLRRSVPYILALAGGLAVKWLLGNALALALRGQMVTGNGDNNMAWDLHDLGGTLAKLVEDTAVNYGLFALEYLPVGIMLAAIFACLIWSIYQSKKEKTGLPVLFFLVLTFSIFLLSIVVGKSVEYRAAAFPIAAYVAFTGLQWLSGPDSRTVGKKIVFVCAAYLLLTQCREMTYRMHIDELRWQEERAVIMDIGYKYESEFDTSKPLVFVGRHQLSNVIMDANYAHKDSFTMRMIARFFPENGMNERRYYCRRVAGTGAFPVITWALDTGNHLIDEIFKYCGYDITTGTPEMFEEVKPLRDVMPAWPAAGSMVDKGDYILVNLGEEFLGGF